MRKLVKALNQGNIYYTKWVERGTLFSDGSFIVLVPGPPELLKNTKIEQQLREFLPEKPEQGVTYHNKEKSRFLLERYWNDGENVEIEKKSWIGEIKLTDFMYEKHGQTWRLCTCGDKFLVLSQYILDIFQDVWGKRIDFEYWLCTSTTMKVVAGNVSVGFFMGTNMNAFSDMKSELKDLSSMF